MKLSSRAALILFIVIVVVAFVQAVWWIAFMAMLVDEKVEIVDQLDGSAQMIEDIHNQEIRRQIMVGTEGIFFLTLILAGSWLIYRSLVHSERLKFQQQNFLMAITHELKTPLASMQMSLDALSSDKVALDKKSDLFPRLQSDLDRLGRIIDNVLHVGRFERRNLNLQLRTVRLDELLHQVLDRFEQNHKSAVTVSRRIETDIFVKADPMALQTVCEAVLDNAVKYRGQPDPEVHVELKSDGRKAQLHVKDNGIGLVARETGAIFERFYRVGNELTRKTDGTGLGLYLARELVRAHHGTIRAESEGLGKGTSIVIRLRKASP